MHPTFTSYNSRESVTEPLGPVALVDSKIFLALGGFPTADGLLSCLSFSLVRMWFECYLWWSHWYLSCFLDSSPCFILVSDGGSGGGQHSRPSGEMSFPRGFSSWSRLVLTCHLPGEPACVQRGWGWLRGRGIGDGMGELRFSPGKFLHKSTLRFSLFIIF